MKTKSPEKQSRHVASVVASPSQPQLSTAAGECGLLWQALRANPVDAQLWRQLAQGYTQKGLPWQRQYALQQMQRCAAHSSAKTESADVPPNILGTVARCWDQGVLVLSQAGEPWPGCDDALNLLRQQLQDEPMDWLSLVYAVRCQELLQGTMGTDAAARIKAWVLQATACEPILGETAYLLAQWRLHSGQTSAALSALMAVVRQAPQRHGSWLLLAETQMQLGQVQAAQFSFERAGQSQNPALLNLLADKLFLANFCDQALAVQQAVTHLQPQLAQNWLRLGLLQSTLWQSQEAAASISRALMLKPGDPVILQSLHDLQAKGDSRQQFDLECARWKSEGLRDNGQGAARLLMHSLYQSHVSAREVANLHREVGHALAQQVQKKYTTQHVAQPHPDPELVGKPGMHLQKGRRRLRVGYVTGDLFRQHPVNIFMLPVLQNHDRRWIEDFVYQTGTMNDEYTRQAQSCVDHWRDVHVLDDPALHRMIVRDKIDVLVDLGGHTATARLGVFALRAAPVQVTYLGYPHSTGLPFMDVLIGDAVVAPPEHAHLFTERIGRVTGSVFCWSPVDEYPLPPDEKNLPNRPVVFGSFNNLLKVNDAVLTVWARVLQAVPDSRLLLKAPVLQDAAIRAQTFERLRSCGISPDRIILRGPSEIGLMMQEYLDMDIALDPFPYNGGTTSLQALWMGCPLVTLTGNNFVSRMGTSFVQALGRPEWAASDEEGYVQVAVRLAKQLRQVPWGRRAWRAEMQGSALCNIKQQTHDIEAIYRTCWKNTFLSSLRLKPGQLHHRTDL